MLTADRRNYTFDNVVFDEAKNRGVIFIPRFGNSTRPSGNLLGDQVVENYNKSTDKEPGGKCHRTCYARVREASGQVGRHKLPDIDWDDKDKLDDFAILWSSHIGDGKEMAHPARKIPRQGRGRRHGHEGPGDTGRRTRDLGGQTETRSGHSGLESSAKDHDNVRDGDPQGASGHSFVFLHYVKSGSSITGMVIADQGYQNGKPLKRSAYGYWVGANINSTGAAAR